MKMIIETEVKNIGEVQIYDDCGNLREAIPRQLLEQYTEPRTADGLTLKELIISIEQHKSIETISNGKWVTISNAEDIKGSIAVCVITEQIPLEIYRIKREVEVTHYNATQGHTLEMICGAKMGDGKWTCNKKQVTCPKCLEEIKYEWIKPGVKCFYMDYMRRKHVLTEVKEINENSMVFVKSDCTPLKKSEVFPVKYEPWTFETAPMSIMLENKTVWQKCSDFDGKEWGFINGSHWTGFNRIFADNWKQIDGTPCGTPVPNLDYYKQFER